jgi:hypothetical protein
MKLLPPGRTAKWLALALLALTAGAGSLVLLRPARWCYYTDGLSIRQPGRDAVIREVLWEEPQLLPGQINEPPDNYEPTLSADGRTLIFARGRAQKNADLFVAQRDAGGWSAPQPLPALNTPFDELGPELSRDGRLLFFYSNRPGGRGGYDLWVSHSDGTNWTEAVNLGDAVNSGFNEYDPALAPGGDRLFFSSNRPRRELTPEEKARWQATLRESLHGADYDLFVAPLNGAGTNATGRATAQVPEFAAATRLDALNSAADEGQPAFTPRGDFLYFSSNRRGGLGGFDLWRSRVLHGEFLPPENPGAPVNSSTDDMDPALWLEGYGLVFSSNRQKPQAREFLLFSTTSREVLARADLPSLAGLWRWLRGVHWWLLLLLLSLAALLWLLRQFVDAERRRRLSLLQRCLLASAALHLLLALLFSLWVLSEAVYQAATEPAMEVALDEGALARERLALEIREQVSELPPSPATLPVEQTAERLPLPDVQPIKTETPAQPAPVNAPVFAVETPQPPPSEPPQERVSPVRVTLAKQLPALNLAPPATQLELPQPAPAPEPKELAFAPDKLEVQPKELAPPVPTPALDAPKLTPESAKVERESAVPSDLPRLDSFERTASFSLTQSVTRLPGALPLAAALEMESRPQPAAAAGGPEPKSPAADAPVAVAAALPTSSAAPQPVGSPALTGAPSKTSPQVTVEMRPASGLPPLPELRSGGAVVAGKLPPLKLATSVTFESPGKLESPYLLRNPVARERVIESLGGSKETEAAIVRALDWLTRHQEQDGRWSVGRFGGVKDHDVAGTGLALLCYLGWGAKHNEPGTYQAPLAKGLDWLLRRVPEDGKLFRGPGGEGSSGGANMYDQGIGGIALAEAYGVTKDLKLREPVRRVIEFIARAQNKETGGWRYQPGDPGDTSVVGWQVMALRSAELAGVPLPDGVRERAARWLDRVGGGEHGGLYGYQNREPRPAMSAEAMFCRQLLGTPPTDPRMKETAAYLRTRLPDDERVNFYYWYYGCLALYQHQGPVWQEWNERMRPIFLNSQRRDGDDAGSWDPEGERGHQCGRLVVTTLATLSLEVYYRYLPLYGITPPAVTRTANR